MNWETYFSFKILTMQYSIIFVRLYIDSLNFTYDLTVLFRETDHTL